MSITNDAEDTSIKVTRDNVLRLTTSDMDDILLSANVSEETRKLIASRQYDAEYLSQQTHLDLVNLGLPYDDAKATSRAFHIAKTLDSLQGIWRVGSYAVSVAGNICRFADGQEVEIMEYPDYLQMRINMEYFRLELSSKSYTWKSKSRVVEWTQINLPIRGRASTWLSQCSSMDSMSNLSSPRRMKLDISSLNANGELVPSEYEEESWDSVDVYCYTPEGGLPEPKLDFKVAHPVPNKPLPSRPKPSKTRPPTSSENVVENAPVKLIPSSKSCVEIGDLGIQIDEHSLTIPAPHSERLFQSSKSVVDMDMYKIQMIKYDSPLAYDQTLPEVTAVNTLKNSRNDAASTFGRLPSLPTTPASDSSFLYCDDLSSSKMSDRKSTVWEGKPCQVKMGGEWFTASLRCEAELDGAFYYGVTVSDSDAARRADIVGLDITVPEERIRSSENIANRPKSLSSVEETAWKWMMNDEVEAMTMYVKLNGNLNITRNGRTMIMEYLNRSGTDLKMVELLVHGGADLSLTSQNGWSCLHYAACHEDPRFLELLLKNCPPELLSLRTTTTTRTASAGLTAESLAKSKGNQAALQEFAKRSIPAMRKLTSKHATSESGSTCASCMSIKALLLPGDIRYVLIMAWKSEAGFDLPFECADLICAFAMKNVQFESEQLQTNQLIHAIKLETGRYITKIEARNALRRVGWHFDRAFTKMRTQMLIRLALERSDGLNRASRRRAQLADSL